MWGATHPWHVGGSASRACGGAHLRHVGGAHPRHLGEAHNVHVGASASRARGGAHPEHVGELLRKWREKLSNGIIRFVATAQN